MHHGYTPVVRGYWVHRCRGDPRFRKRSSETKDTPRRWFAVIALISPVANCYIFQPYLMILMILTNPHHKAPHNFVNEHLTKFAPNFGTYFIQTKSASRFTIPAAATGRWLIRPRDNDIKRVPELELARNLSLPHSVILLNTRHHFSIMLANYIKYRNDDGSSLLRRGVKLRFHSEEVKAVSDLESLPLSVSAAHNVAGTSRLASHVTLSYWNL